MELSLEGSNTLLPQFSKNGLEGPGEFVSTPGASTSPDSEPRLAAAVGSRMFDPTAICAIPGMGAKMGAPPDMNAPSISARFRTQELIKLRLAMKPLICARASDRVNGYARNEVYFRVLPERLPAKASYDAELMDRILGLWTRIFELAEAKEKSRRVLLDLVDLWILGLVIKVAKHQQGHDVNAVHVPSAKARWSKLVEKIQRLQRRARNLWKRSPVAGSYQSWRSRWEGFESWIKTYYGCLCRQPATGMFYRRLRWYVDLAVEVARHALKEAEIECPDDRQLRHFVRMAFAEIKRGRRPYSIPEILKGGRRVSLFLSRFIENRLRKTGELKFIE